MLTEEEIKSLKKGDKVLAEASVENVFTDGDIQVRVKSRKLDNTIGESLATLHSSCLSLAKTKYDPCRKFKEGDIVEPVERDGREYKDTPPLGARCRVCENENNGMVAIVYKAGSALYKHDVPFYHLELVTPVEERMPRFSSEDYERKEQSNE